MRICFRRWSRKSYAVFAGLHKVIAIGHLSSGICEAANKKNDTGLTNSSEETFFNTDNQEEEQEKEALLLLLSENINIVSPSSISLVGRLFKIFITSPTVEFQLKI